VRHNTKEALELRRKPSTRSSSQKTLLSTPVDKGIKKESEALLRGFEAAPSG
jgi:hypothetical protein